jgi:hypothetical protein
MPISKSDWFNGEKDEWNAMDLNMRRTFREAMSYQGWARLAGLSHRGRGLVPITDLQLPHHTPPRHGSSLLQKDGPAVFANFDVWLGNV